MRRRLCTAVMAAVLLPAAPAAADGVTDRLDITAPTASIAALPAYTAATTLRVAYAGADKESGVKNFDVRLRTAPWRSNFGAYTQPASWQARTARTLTFGVRSGTDYCVSVRSRDNNGNVSAWTADACSAVALDDRSLAASGSWRRSSERGSYLGTLTQSASFKSVLTVAARGSRMALVVTTCPACGKVAISLDGKTGRLVDTRSATVARRTILVQPGGSRIIEATIRLYVAQTRPVYIDGVAVTTR